MNPLVRVRAEGSDFYLTAAVPRGLAAAEAARRIYAEIAALVAAQGLDPIQEKVYGMTRARAAVLQARAAAFQARGLDASLPVSYLEGKPLSGAGLAGVQMWALRRGRRGPRQAATVRHARGVARLWSSGGTRFIYLPAISGASPDGTAPRDRPSQARSMFRAARSALKRHGFEYAHVVRTWIYLRRILEWYGDFNRERNALYRRPDFFGRGFRGRAPASTGIEGFSGSGDCVMDVLAVQTEGRRPAVVDWICRSGRQGPATAYGSAFSRAVALRAGRLRTIHVSGTASIDAAGNSVAVGDPEGQSLQTLRSVGALLASRGAGWKDVCASVLFCKDRRAGEAFFRMRRRLRLPDWPVIALLADVCRPELQVELEAVALLPARPSVRRQEHSLQTEA